jgi:hypothetical protein
MTKHIPCQDSALTTMKLADGDILNSWVIARLLPDMQRVTIASFRHRSHAERYLRNLRHLIPDARFVVVFDAQHDEAVI